MKFETRMMARLAGAAIALVAVGLLTWTLPEVAPLRIPVSARPHADVTRGEYGGDLAFLRRHWVAPEVPGESNHCFDLWSPDALLALTRVHGLTNNRALFVDSHGKAGCSSRGTGFGFYPRAALVHPGAKTPYFSARDLATVLGPKTAATIHNIVLAGCNEQGWLRSAEFRRHFVNATNITYMEPGRLAFKPMFYQAIILPSAEIKALHGKPRRVSADRIECDIVDEPRRGTRPLGAYIADLYLRGGRKPYQTRKAGRELLEPLRVATVATRTDGAHEQGEPVPSFARTARIAQLTFAISPTNSGCSEHNNKIIPGHGPLASRSDLEQYRDMLVDTIALVKKAIADGKSAADVKAAGIPEKYKDWGAGFINTGRWLEISYNSLSKK